MHVDYLIVGQGIAGSLLWWQIRHAGKTAVVLDLGMGTTSTQVAAGIVNPVTGKQMKVTWQADKILPVALDTYRAMEMYYGIQVVHEMPMYRLLADVFSRNEWDTMSGESPFSAYLGPVVLNNWPSIRAQGGLGTVKGAFWVDTVPLLQAARADMAEMGSLRTETFDHEALKAGESSVKYKDIQAKQVIFCEGSAVHLNPYFRYLPIGFAKGEVLHISSEDILPDAMLNKNGYLVPLGNNEYKLGATYHHDDRDTTPSGRGLAELEEKLAAMVTIQYKVISQQSGLRPTSKDRRPVLGRHPEYKNLYIFNGLGTKGISLAPFFAAQLIDHIETGKALWPEVALSRFK